MPVLSTPTSTFYLRTWQVQAPAAVVALFHGFGEHARHYDRFANALNAHDIEVWGMDLIGHGHTPGEAGMFGSLDALVDNASALVAKMTEVRPDVRLAYVGHSLGGLVATLLTNRREPSCLVATGAPFAGAPAELPNDIVMSEDSSYLDALANDPLIFDTAPAEPALWSAVETARPDLDAAARATRAPTLLVYGTHDCFTSVKQAEDWTDRFPHAELITFEGHHDIVNDRAHDELAQHVSTFIIKHSA